MIFLEIAELFVVLLIFIFALFQVIIPIWNGTVLFPSFRSKSRQLESQLRQARSDLELLQEQKNLDELKGKSDDSEKNL